MKDILEDVQPWLWFTLGPATLDHIDEALSAGATGIRHTLSFATPELHVERARTVAKRASVLGLDAYSVADLPGEKFRLASFPGEKIEVDSGDGLRLGLTPDLSAGIPVLPLQTDGIFSGVRPGSRIIVGDGGVELSVDHVGEDFVTCTVVRGGTIENNRGLTLVGGVKEPRSLATADLEMLRVVASSGVFDAVALSFVSDPADLRRAREVMASVAERSLPLVAKIETVSGVDRVDEICHEADVIMAARGDLALAVGPASLYSAVSDIADAAMDAGVPWLLATQLLEGLDHFGFPTRAELTDLAGWMNRGAAGAMLSRETVFGRKPLESIRFVRSLLDAPLAWRER